MQTTDYYFTVICCTKIFYTTCSNNLLQGLTHLSHGVFFGTETARSKILVKTV